jgi:hypothetical protein
MTTSTRLLPVLGQRRPVGRCTGAPSTTAPGTDQKIGEADTPTGNNSSTDCCKTNVPPRFQLSHLTHVARPKHGAPHGLPSGCTLVFMSYDLLAIGSTMPDLRNALCRNRSELFYDEDTYDEAIGLCRRCDELGPCAHWVASLSPRDGPTRCVVAAQIR